MKTIFDCIYPSGDSSDNDERYRRIRNMLTNYYRDQHCGNDDESNDESNDESSDESIDESYDESNDESSDQSNDESDDSHEQMELIQYYVCMYVMSFESFDTNIPCQIIEKINIEKWGMELICTFINLCRKVGYLDDKRLNYIAIVFAEILERYNEPLLGSNFESGESEYFFDATNFNSNSLRNRIYSIICKHYKKKFGIK